MDRWIDRYMDRWKDRLLDGQLSRKIKDRLILHGEDGSFVAILM
tara:strand:- start:417 stop:548 length:132 start_codon:yes stop_codon:yes gene_type:complete